MTRQSAYELAPMIRWVRELPGDFRLCSEVADELGRSPEGIRLLPHAHPDDHLGPSHTVQYRNTILYLYSPERVELIRSWLADHPKVRKDGSPDYRGQMRLWSVEERRQRRRDRSLLRYYERRAKELAGPPTEAKAEKARAKAAELRTKLEEAYRTRYAEITRPRLGGSVALDHDWE